MSWTENLKNILQSKSKLSTEEVNDFLLKHLEWSVSTVKDALGYEMLETFCAVCKSYNMCWKKLGVFEMENVSGCICGEFLNPKAQYLEKALSSSLRKVLQQAYTSAQLIKE